MLATQTTPSGEDLNATVSIDEKTGLRYKGKTTPEEREAAADRNRQTEQAARSNATIKNTGLNGASTPAPSDPPHYYGPYPNYANSPMPTGSVATVTITSGGTGYFAPVVEIVDLYNTGSGATATATADPATGAITGVTITNAGSGYTAPVVYVSNATAPQGADAQLDATIGGALSGGIRKFISALPSISVAVPDTTTYPDADYYELELRQYTQQLHPDLPATTLRGYVQVKNGQDVSPISYLGPTIVAQRDRPVRVKFTNKLPTGAGGNLFLPVDPTVMGAGMGPLGMNAMPMDYTQNRANIHLHGGATPWISDGTPHQWITPAGENTPYPKGVSVVNVPDMPDPGDGSMTFYYTNQQSARLMFYHDHSYGITRLNVYAGEAAPYLVTDKIEQDMIDGTNNSGINPTGAKVLPDAGIPLVIQDKTFVDATTIGYQDPTWKWGSTPGTAHTGDLWLPHVYMTNQNPYDSAGMNAYGRWHYGPWFWPPTRDVVQPVANPYYNPSNPSQSEPPLIPGVPSNSMAMESFMDTPVVNGEAYPYLDVQPTTVRFRILNTADDRFVNLQLYVADPNVVTADGRTNTEVKMVPAQDGREGGVPDPATAGPSMIQIGTEGGFLPAPVVLPNTPVAWNLDQTNFDFGNVNDGTLILGTAERADVLIDFSQYAGKTLILYNDAPAPFPAIDPRYDYYTGDADETGTGGTPPTQPGYGPNTRTIMQIRVAATTPAPAYDLATLQSVFAKTAGKLGVFEASQDEIIVPSAPYNSAYDATFPAEQFAGISANTLTYKNVSGATVTSPRFEPKAIQDEMGEAFDEYGRMSGFLGLQLDVSLPQNFILMPFASPPVELIKSAGVYGQFLGNTSDGTQFWKITHNGVDTHTIHVHLFNAQIVNRVAWDNALRSPDLNELGWKETFRVNPLQDTIIAFRPVTPTQPFEVPNSVRLIDPTMPEGATLMGGPFGSKDTAGNPVTVTNHYVNYGWEYVYHCHLLSHEEMDMMHSMAFAAPPRPPSNLSAVSLNGNQGIQLTWTDASTTETGFVIQRAADAGFTNSPTTFTVGANVKTYTDTTADKATQYFYRVLARNLVGDTVTPGFPTLAGDSAWSNTASPGGATPAPTAPTGVTATAARVNNNFDRVTLTWTDTSTTETGFRIQQATDSGFTANVVTSTVGADIVRFRTLNLPLHTSYYFRVQSFNAAGASAWVNAAPLPVLTP
jgi:FtsP/CotA-like multicopper oxidase with cupredoxin domain